MRDLLPLLALPMPGRFVLAALAIALASPALGQSFEILNPLPGHALARATAVSDDGTTVVGWSGVTGLLDEDAVRWVDGTAQALSLPFVRDGQREVPTGVSADGSVIVGWIQGRGTPSPSAFNHAWRWQDGAGSFLQGAPIDFPDRQATGVSADASRIVGEARFGDEAGIVAAQWIDGALVEIGDFSGGDPDRAVALDLSADFSTIVGWGTDALGKQALYFRDNRIQYLAPGPDNYLAIEARAVNTDGSIVAGIAQRTTTGQIQAFRWAGGFTTIIGPLPAGGSDTFATDMSADGQVIVGTVVGPGIPGGSGAWVWTPETGIRLLREVLEEDYGLGDELEGWQLLGAEAISADGRVIVGEGLSPVGGRQAFRVSLVPTWAPAEDEIVPPGEPYEVEFVAPDGAETIDLYLVANSQSSGGARTRIAEGLSAAAGTFEWEVDEDLLSPSTFLIAVDASTPSEEVVGPRFRVRPRYRLMRVAGTVAQPTYELAFRGEHAWSFAQVDENLWPTAYWDRPTRNYNGFPEFGRDPYYDNPEVRYFPTGFPDVADYWYTPWTAWVDAFGTEATYTSLEPQFVPGFEALVNQPDLGALEVWRTAVNPGYGQTLTEAAYDSYEGVCYGLSNAMLAAFADPDRFTAAWLPSLAGGDLGAVPLSDEVRDVAHALQNRTRDERFERSRDSQSVFSPPTSSFPATPRKVLAQLKAMLSRDERDLDRVVWFSGRMSGTDANGDPLRSAHAVAPLGLEDEWDVGEVDAGEAGDGRYALVFYDPNIARSDEFFDLGFMLIDSTANAWGPYDPWLGETGRGLFIGPEVLDIYDVGNPSWRARSPSAAERSTSPDFVSVYVAGRSSAVVAPNGDRLAFEQGVLTETLDQAYVRFPITGQPSRPESYRVPRASYRAEVTPDEGGFARLAVDWGRLRLGVERTDGLPEARDAFAIDLAGTAALTSAGGEVMLRALTTVGAGEARLFVADSLAVGAGTEARLAMTADSSGFALGGLAEAATYDLTLAVSAPGTGTRSFYHADVPLLAGATHTVRPVWGTLGDEVVTVEVDTDGDGDTDETLVLLNEGLPVASEDDAAQLPEAFALGAYPNPTAGTATVELALPEAADVRAEVFDLLGRRVAMLHDGLLAAGTHPLPLDAARLPAGLYVVRAVTPTATLTKRLTVVR